MGMGDRWYKNGVIYALDVETFMDADSDGVGDFQGLIGRLDYLSRLGVTCIWLLPFYPTPNRDNGYDVMDYYGVDPRLGTLGDFVEFVREAEERGMEVVIDLVVNHTSDQHPWFQEARRNPNSPYRDYYIWADEPEATKPGKGNVFPGEEESNRVWTYDETADAYYYHRFYRFQPDLNVANPDVREEIRKIMGFWLELGVSGFRIDAATLMIDAKAGTDPVEGDPHEILKEIRGFATNRTGDAVLLAEADDDPDKLAAYFGDGDEMNMLLNFLLDAHLVLALAREEADPLVRVLDVLPQIPEEGQWVNFLRNFDELNIGRLTKGEQADVFEAFAPDEDMRIYGRGIRRRMAPMLDGDRRRLELAYSLLFSMPGTPLIVYGEEIGIGDDLSQSGRNAVRTPMQWSDEDNAGFSTASREELVRPPASTGKFGYERVNVAAQRSEPDSLLNWMQRLIGTRKECPEIGWGDCRVVETGNQRVFAHCCEWQGKSVLAVHNLAPADATATLDVDIDGETPLYRLFGDATVELAADGTPTVELAGYGYCWLRVGGSRAGHPS